VSDLAELSTRLRAFAAARDWERFHTPKNLLLALAGEVGELAAELQWLSEQEADPSIWDSRLRTRVTDEVADVMIYLVRFADVCGINPVAAAHDKIHRNENRFPLRAVSASRSESPGAKPPPGTPPARSGQAALPYDPETPLESSPRPDGHRA
jgi:NTP pyrophosphatase (non-canonical NTP hydrolase)